MKFVGLGSLSAKQLLVYGIVGLIAGSIANMFTVVIGDILLLTGSLCLIGSGVKWYKAREKGKGISRG